MHLCRWRAWGMTSQLPSRQVVIVIVMAGSASPTSNRLAPKGARSLGRPIPLGQSAAQNAGLSRGLARFPEWPPFLGSMMPLEGLFVNRKAVGGSVASTLVHGSVRVALRGRVG